MNTKRFWKAMGMVAFAGGVGLFGYAVGELRALNNASRALTDALTDSDPEAPIAPYTRIKNAYFSKGGTCINIEKEE